MRRSEPIETAEELYVSEHAILRYLERKLRIGVKRLRREVHSMVKGKTREEIEALGFRIQGKTIVTYVPKVLDQSDDK